MSLIRGGGGSLTPEQEDAVDSIVNLSDDTVPKASSGALVDGSSNVDPTTNKTKFDGSVGIPQASLDVSDIVTLSEATGFLVLKNNVTDLNFYQLDYLVTNQGTFTPNFLTTSSEFVVSTQPDNSQQITTNPLINTRVVQADVLSNAITIETFATMTNTRALITDTVTGVPIKYIPDEKVWVNGVGGLDLRLGTNKVDFVSRDPSDPPNGIFNQGYSPLSLDIGRSITIEVRADSVSLLGDVSGDMFIESLSQPSILEKIASLEDTTNIKADYITVNDEYVSTTATTPGLVVNYQATSTVDTVTGGLATAGDIGVSNPTIVTDGSATFAQGDLVQLSASILNNGIYEVEDHTGTTLTIRGVGTVPTIELFTKDDFRTTVGNSVLTKVNVSALRAGVNGEWEQGKGSSTPLSFNIIDVFGSEFEEFNSLAQSSTTSSSFQSKLSATTALKPAGKYRITFNAQATNKDGDKATEVEFEVNGVAQHNHVDGGNYITVISKEDNQWTSEFIVSYITLGSPATIDLDINYRKDDKTARISDARIEIWRVL